MSGDRELKNLALLVDRRGQLVLSDGNGTRIPLATGVHLARWMVSIIIAICATAVWLTWKVASVSATLKGRYSDFWGGTHEAYADQLRAAKSPNYPTLSAEDIKRVQAVYRESVL